MRTSGLDTLGSAIEAFEILSYSDNRGCLSWLSCSGISPKQGLWWGGQKEAYGQRFFKTEF